MQKLWTSDRLFVDRYWTGFHKSAYTLCYGLPGDLMRVLSIGEILWDKFPDQERLGGAALNFCANVRRLGDSAALLTAVGNDSRGLAALETMKQIGLTTELVQVVADRATGVAQVGVTAAGDPSFEIPRPAAFDHLSMTPDLRDAVAILRPDWLYFGTLLQIQPHIEKMTADLARNLPRVRCFYDINLREGHWNLPLVERLSRLASIVKMNELEAQTLAALSGIVANEFSLESFCKSWAGKYDVALICITLGKAGCYVYEADTTYNVPGYPVAVQDTVGAGDGFAAAFLHGYYRGWPIVRIARFANALGSIIASKAGATPTWSLEECLAVASMSKNDVIDVLNFES
jgi:fructokinase